ncbi:hypothetical protein HG536_0G02220 [Torulaspora globosa]|uniref:ZZ-type domain-containing protein n=1 Tax=Torulaspora globosa TaxID=48254 RepID=A0A7G3ZLH7_9SACH|nr:uncharacterized protein HG536_0G02220 [Torulaspora globosa]QLL34363.1 hypothetical protein HG536_0G02220 [Torulaspora globosa]
MSLGNAGIVYGTRGEVFEGQRDGSLKDFIASTFNIHNVFQTKLVMGRCICHGKKALETDKLLDNEEEANKFISSRDSKKPHVILIYDKHGDSSSVKESNPEKNDKGNVVISPEQWDDLVSLLKKVEITLKEKEKDQHHGGDVVHPHVICDGCYPTEQTDASEIRGPRFKCLTCHNFDLCSSCESKGYETFGHKRSHNMVKVNKPTENDVLSAPVGATLQSANKVFNTDKEVVVDIPADRKDLFDMFSNLENLDGVVHGYTMYKKWTEKYDDDKIDEILKSASAKPAVKASRSNKKRATQAKPSIKQGGVVVEVAKKDNAMIFHLRNRDKVAVPGGLTFVGSAIENGGHDDGCWELPMGPHELQPGSHKVLKYNCHPGVFNFPTSAKSRITLVDEQKDVKYEGFTNFEPGSHFILHHSGAKPQQDLVLINDVDTLQLLDKDDSDSVISSSTVTNDNDTSQSVSNHESFDWEDYDFLSESDV